MMHTLDDLLKIYNIAVSYDYHSDYKYVDSPRLLPQEVLSTLTALLRADGGNFSIYRNDGNYLEVRGWYCLNDPNIGYTKFRDRIMSISSDKQLRKKSSSYRCIDSSQPVIVPKSSSEHEALMTLDIATLDSKDGMSAIAVPMTYNGRVMGVIHMDIADSSKHNFDEANLAFLGNVATLISPILHHNLMMEQLSAMTQACFSDKAKTQYHFARALCVSATEIFLVPNVGLWLVDPNAPENLLLRGYTGSIFDGSSDVFIRLDCEKELLTSEGNRPLRTRFPADLDALLVPLRDEQAGLIIGCLGLVDNRELPNSDSYFQLASFVAKFLSLTLGTLSRYEARERSSYEIAAHEFRRNLKSLDNTHARFERALGILDRAAKHSRVLSDEDIHRMRTICNAFKSHLSAAVATQQSLVRGISHTDVSELYGNKYDFYTPEKNPLLREAATRQKRLTSEGGLQSVDIRREILDICNGFTHYMEKLGIRWSLRIERPPRLLNVDRQNFIIVFGNVADNAVKYAKRNSVIVVWLLVEDLRVLIYVTNVGPPVDMYGAEGSDIFLAHQRGRLAEKMCKGDGIGLWQAKYVASLWEGDLRLTESTVVEGGDDTGADEVWARNTFVIEIPDTPLSHRTYSRGRRGE